ncbi:MAG TPA: hypothetical protein PKO36_00410 [Candidatus Hydrogenedentes bacterium]|nr:hypothetical protein [Candidatus Hydrogenedentota bacterium]HOV73045.1 hypothetical protein [Candidatus Hydrogenedentota bacterium]
MVKHAVCIGVLVMGTWCVAQTEGTMPVVPENLYTGELVSYPGPWSFLLHRAHIILVSDEELEQLSDPDKVLNLSLTYDKVEKSLRQVCEEARNANARTLIIAFDHFFVQYRPGQDQPRRLTPDMDEYVQRIAAIGKFAQEYGLGLELSLLSPLEIGPAYQKATGESGLWMHYRKGLRDPKTGRFDVQLWRQHRWTNNKGPIDIEDAGVRVFAFKEQGAHGASCRFVDPKGIVEISDVAQTEVWESLDTKIARRVRVHGEGRTDIGPLDRVLVVQQYRVPEMDYFSEQAMPFLKGLIDKYVAAGVKLNGLYADEMHIQQDWGYFNHHDNGEFALRYVSPGFAKRFAALYGAQYADFAKYMIYFCYGQEDTAYDVSAKDGVMHVFGATPERIRETALFRSRYYKLLQDGVVDLFAGAKRYAEQGMGHRLESRAHATWAESPTIDRWNVGQDRHAPNQYEYTSNFVWSCTVHQAASACHDYFKWGDFLTGNGNDHAEGGWLDRDYFALALGCSTGILNEVPYSYAAHWGMPHELSQRRMSLVNAYGAAGTPLYGIVEDMQHRDVEVLMLYPLDLVAAEERFGSWMTQYGYANYVTQAKLMECAQVVPGGLEMAGRKFTTLCTLFEPFPSKAFLEFVKAFVESGGRLVWSGPPPVLTAEGDSALPAWQDLTGVDYTPNLEEGRRAPGRLIAFEGVLAHVAPQVILTDFLVDRIYPVVPREGTETVARTQGLVVGTHRRAARGGSTTVLGYRPRDDQAQSLGYETRNWFEVLDALGAYPPTGRIGGVNDNTEYVSRTTPYLACRFPNGATAIAPHFRDIVEDWPGGFARKQDEDKAYLDKNPPPSEALKLDDLAVNGHRVTYDGKQAVAFRVDDAGRLVAFAGSHSTRITIDGRETVFADAPFGVVAWAPVPESRKVADGAILQLMAHGQGVLRIPAETLPESVTLFAEGPKPGSRGAVIPFQRENGALVFTVTPELSGRWIYAVP